MEMKIYSVLGVPCGFRMVSSFAEKDRIKATGFKWDPAQKNWFTTSFEVAGRMAAVADEDAARWLKEGSFPDPHGQPPGMCQKAWEARQAEEKKARSASSDEGGGCRHLKRKMVATGAECLVCGHIEPFLPPQGRSLEEQDEIDGGPYPSRRNRGGQWSRLREDEGMTGID